MGKNDGSSTPMGNGVGCIGNNAMPFRAGTNTRSHAKQFAKVIVRRWYGLSDSVVLRLGISGFLERR